jgi:excisionase family DNA binding protein
MNTIQTTQNDGVGKTWKTKREIACHFECNVRTITKLMKQRILPFVKIGRLVRFDVAECDLALEKYKFKSRYD